ncbi:UNVERIFIED_ORG: hypothetical protein M2393_001079 [Pseudomonas psychrophila]
MDATDSMTTGVDQTFFLMGYSNREVYWRLDQLRDGSIRVSGLEERPADASTGGIFGWWKLAGGEAVPMAYFSQQLDGELGIPNFAENLVLLINGKLMGDGVAVPEISFRRGIFSSDFSVRLKDGWVFQVHYSRPLLREAWWRFNVGGTLDYYPVDFIEQLVEIVAMNRPHWLVDDQS